MSGVGRTLDAMNGKHRHGAAIEVEGLVKRFGDTVALDGIGLV
ncbi:MAG: hypothetical protein QOI16_2184, partial [Pseudonocardiales bacterium]|nr:hypothetical protein [Pseudonocardiales bacterium]